MMLRREATRKPVARHSPTRNKAKSGKRNYRTWRVLDEGVEQGTGGKERYFGERKTGREVRRAWQG